MDVSAAAIWVSAIPVSEWPQQDRARKESLYPAMIATHREDWYGAATATRALIDECLALFPGGRQGHSMLSMLVPGQSIEPHDDVQSEAWRARVHIPLVTNDGVRFSFPYAEFRMPAGFAYLFNPEIQHTIRNDGQTNRVHLFFDVLA